MVHVKFNPELLGTLKDKVVVLTGGATGIGRAAVIQFAEAGSKVVYGDLHNPPLPSSLPPSLTQNIQYQHCDTTSYASLLSLFAYAHTTFSRIDIVVANAGVGNPKSIFAPTADINEEPSLREIDVNLKGVIFTTRIGLFYLRKNGGEGGDMVLVSSIAGFKESEELPVYSASKHGVLGLMRGLHTEVVKEGVRINVICPWMTKTQMVKGIEDGWAKLKLPENTPEDVARSFLVCASAERSTDGTKHEGARSPFAGKILWIGGGEAYEIEDAIQELEPKWLGEENSRVLKIGQEFLASGGTSWNAEK
ncbi:putative estradiol 17 beta-dehydrogenase [Periconia macrospinosa]|uniref:Putative estradiol 17 beta-dehydrogenase n=1 Tax=Periconia macrospinosa TaxID=97972 RepID=A0A2V1DV76_9PLEO|nr:putative estradiol 17 beta-dehydrogenase [Periconia macrospinosa]